MTLRTGDTYETATWRLS